MVCKNVRIWVKGISVPFVSGIPEHESLITSSHIFFVFLLMDCISNFSSLSLNIDDNFAIIAINTLFLTSESYLSKCLSYDLLKVNLFSINIDFTEKHNLFQKIRYISMRLTKKN
jgi:hypothetical protein